MTQKRREADSGKAIGEMTALRWEPTHVTKPNPRIVPLQSVCKLYVRSLCSLPSLVICTVVSQVTVLPSYNSKATVSLLCSLPVPIYSNLFEFIVNLFEFRENLASKEREC